MTRSNIQLLSSLCNNNALDLYSEGNQFEPQSGYQLPHLFFVIFLSLS